MKRLFILLALLFLAPSIIDQLDAEFAQGTHQNTQNLSNTVILEQIGGNYLLSGAYLSSTKDLGSNPTTTIGWLATLPAQTSLIVTTRSGGVPIPDGTWTGWSAAYATSAGSLVTSTTNRYLQYRLQLATTDNQETPAVDAVVLTYTEQGPIIEEATAQNAALTSETIGVYRFHFTVQDTLNSTLVQVRAQVATQGYSAYTNASVDGNHYYIDVPQPTGGWSAFSEEDLFVNVYVENANTNANTTLTKEIVHINQPPVIVAISDRTAIEGQPISISVSGSDPDGDTLIFSSSHGTVQTVSTTTATIAWTPNAQDVGNTTVTVTVSDGQASAQTTFVATVLAFNYPPVLQAIPDRSGHYGDRIVFDLTVLDPNSDENMTYWVEPNLFRITPLASNTSGTYLAQADFIALDDHRGTTNLTFYVSDGEYTSQQSATLAISFCGDNICQTQENQTSCPQDCRQFTVPSYVVLEVPQRFCINQTAVLHTYNASSRYSCYLDGRAFQGAAYCNLFSGVSITVFSLQGAQRQQLQTLTTDAQGQASFTPQNTGRYRILAESEGMVAMDQMVTVNDCSVDINLVEEVVNFERPNVPPPQRRPPQTPQIERPELTPEQTSLLSILVWYIVIPLLAASMLYTTTAWYDIHKDTNVHLLSLRVTVLELQKKLAPIVMPPLRRLWSVVAPFARPVAVHVYHGVLLPTGRFARSVINRFKR